MATATQVETQRESTTGRQDILPILNRLQQLLPLARRRRALAPHLRMVHRAILKSLGETGKPPTQAEIAAMLGSRQSALHALAVLGSNDLVVLSAPVVREEKTQRPILEERVEVIGAYPMTTDYSPHKVFLCGHPVNAMCAVDALAISAMFGRETRIESRCHVSGSAVQLVQQGVQILEAIPSSEVRVGIRWQGTGTCAAQSLCTEMVFLKDENVANSWRNTDPNSIDVLTLPEAIELGTAFFLPLLED